MSLILAFQATKPAASSTSSSTADLPSDVAAGITNLATVLIHYLAPLVGVGAVSMSLIEVWKKFFDSRTKFHTRRWVRWMRDSYTDSKPRKATADEWKLLLKTPAKPNADSPVEALSEMLQLCTGVPTSVAKEKATYLLTHEGRLGWTYGWRRTPVYAVFALELERMMGSIQEAADTVLANPTKYAQLYLFLTKGAVDTDKNKWLGSGKDKNGDDTDGPALLAAAAQKSDANSRAKIKELSELSARLRQIIKGKLDGFQLYTADSWANWNQLFANIVGIILMYFTLRFTYGQVSGSMIPLALLGGILSPVAKDLVSALRNAKDG